MLLPLNATFPLLSSSNLAEKLQISVSIIHRKVEDSIQERLHWSSNLSHSDTTAHIRGADFGLQMGVLPRRRKSKDATFLFFFQIFFSVAFLRKIEEIWSPPALTSSAPPPACRAAPPAVVWRSARSLARPRCPSPPPLPVAAPTSSSRSRWWRSSRSSSSSPV